MKERPILFNGEMVRAILDGRKTQTRRVMKYQPGEFQHVDHDEQQGWHLWWDVVTYDSNLAMGAYQKYAPLTCPYGKPGDRLWVREGFAIVPRTAYRCSTGVQQVLCPDNDHDAAVFREGWDRVKPGSWKPSIHMPRWASRLTLEVVSVRVERVHDITVDDIEAEGVYRVFDSQDDTEDARQNVGLFADLWDSINGKRGYGWDVNPWVWVVEFKRLEA